MSKTTELLFEYLRDIFYAPAKASLDIDALDTEYREVGKALLFVGDKLTEQRAFASSLAKGELSEHVPSSDNELASSLKALHASLRHLTWQTQQVAKGDYKQRVDFMGEFSEAFNSMTRQLQSRQHELEMEIELGREKALALEQSNALLTNITSGLPQCIVVIGRATGDVLYQNKAARNLMETCPLLLPKLQDILRLSPLTLPDGYTEDFALEHNNAECIFSASSYALRWQGRDAKAFVVNDVSDERALVRELEHFAFQDNLTKLYNRHSGMRILHSWVSEKKVFSLCFADLDNLKYVNDTFGHLEGDQYLINAARQLETASPNFIVCRVGGDEFMLLMPDISVPEAEKVMLGVRKRMRRLNEQTARRYTGSMSFGIVAVDENNQYTASEILGLADERMYEYKRKSKKILQNLAKNYQ